MAQQAAEKELLDGAMEQWLAYLILRSSNIGPNKEKYGSVSRGMQSQFSMNNDQYPRTIIGITDVLTNHSWDNRTSRQKKGNHKKDHDDHSNNNNNEERIPASGNATSFCTTGQGNYLLRVWQERP